MSVEVRVVVDKFDRAVRILQDMQRRGCTGKMVVVVDSGNVVAIEVTERV